MACAQHIVELRTTSVWDYVAVIMKSLKLSAHDVTPQLESAWAHQAVVVCHRAARCAVNAPAYSGDTANFQQTYGRLLNLLVNRPLLDNPEGRNSSTESACSGFSTGSKRW